MICTPYVVRCTRHRNGQPQATQSQSAPFLFVVQPCLGTIDGECPRASQGGLLNPTKESKNGKIKKYNKDKAIN